MLTSPRTSMPRWLLLYFPLHYPLFTLDIVCSFSQSNQLDFLNLCSFSVPLFWTLSLCSPSFPKCPKLANLFPTWAVCSRKPASPLFPAGLSCRSLQRRTWDNRLKLLTQVTVLIHCNLLLSWAAWCGLCLCRWLALPRCATQYFPQTGSSLSRLFSIQVLPCSKYSWSPFWVSIICIISILSSVNEKKQAKPSPCGAPFDVSFYF